MAGISIGSFAFGVIAFLVGIYIYRAPNLERMRRYYYFYWIPGGLFSVFPLGAAFIVFGFFPWIENDFLRLGCLYLAVLLVLIGVVLWTWSPKWTRPYWMRDDPQD